MRLAARVLGDGAEAEDVVQQAWLRLHGTSSDIENLPAWLTTVTTRLCLDRLRARVPAPTAEVPDGETTADPADAVALAETVGLALDVVLDRLTPSERVSFVLHDSSGFEFATIAAVLDTCPAAARKLASRARAKIGQPSSEDRLADWEVVDAFMAAAQGGRLRPAAAASRARCHPHRRRRGDPGRHPRAGRGPPGGGDFLDGSAQPALPAFVGDRPGAAWFHRGRHGCSSTSPSSRCRARHHLPGRPRRAGTGGAARRPGAAPVGGRPSPSAPDDRQTGDSTPAPREDTP